MVTIIEIEKLALNFPERDRATLAAKLLNSLPSIVSDADGGIAEALQRDAEIEADPAQAISLGSIYAVMHFSKLPGYWRHRS